MESDACLRKALVREVQRLDTAVVLAILRVRHGRQMIMTWSAVHVSTLAR